MADRDPMQLTMAPVSITQDRHGLKIVPTAGVRIGLSQGERFLTFDVQGDVAADMGRALIEIAEGRQTKSETLLEI